MGRKARAWVQPLDRSAEELYTLNEKGEEGFFPVGAHAFWHGGVHFVPKPDEDVRCLADGVLVAARLPADPDPRPARTLFGAKVSRSFALVRHDLPLEKGTASVWTLAMHLAPFDYEADDDPRAPKPLQSALKQYNAFKAADGAKLGSRSWSARYYEVARADDPEDPLAKSGPAWGLRLREDSKERTVLAVLPPGTIAKIVRPPEKHWAKVEVAPDPNVSVPPGTAFTHPLTGMLYTKKKGKQDRVRLIDSRPHQAIADLRAGRVALLSEPVKAGERLGRSGDFDGGRRVHVEVFSEEPLHETISELKSVDVYDDDRDDDRLVEVAELKARIDLLEPWVGAKLAAKLAATKGRDAAAYFHTEWRIVDWSFLEKLPLPKAFLGLIKAQIERLLWWDRARALLDKAKRGAELPKNPRVWHYHPVTFVTRLQQAFELGGSLHKTAAAPAPAGAVSTSDPAPFTTVRITRRDKKTKKKVTKTYHAYEAPAGTTDPRHVIHQGLAKTEGKYDTVNMWDNAVVSLGVGQWTLTAGKLQKLFDVLRQSSPDDYKRLIVDTLKVDLPTPRNSKGDLTMFHDGKELATRSDAALVKRILDRGTAVKNEATGKRWAGKVAREVKWGDYEIAFDRLDADFKTRVKGAAAVDDFDWDELVKVFGEVCPPNGDRDDGNAWVERFEACGRDPVMRQIQFDLKNYDLMEFFGTTMKTRATGTWQRYNKKITKVSLRAPLGTNYGKFWKLVDGDLWLQCITYNLFVNTPVLAYLVIGSAVHKLAKRKGWKDQFATWPDRDQWRDEFVHDLYDVIAVTNHNKRTLKSGKIQWPWRDSRHEKALTAYQTLTGDTTDDRNAPSFGGITFDSEGRPDGPANAIAGFRAALRTTDEVKYLKRGAKRFRPAPA